MELATYLADEYASTKERIIEVKTVLNQIANLFNDIYKNKPRGEIGWPYSWRLLDSTSDQWLPKKRSKNNQHRVSISTQAMCCSGIESLISADNAHHYFKTSMCTNLTSYKDQVLRDLFCLIENSLTKNNIGWDSHTFGKDDIFTASWLLPHCSQGCSAKVRSRIIQILAKSASSGFDHNLFVKDGNEAGPHPLPLLRVIRAEKVAQRSNILAAAWDEELNAKGDKTHKTRESESGSLKTKKLIKQAGEWFERNLHRQLSFYRFDDFRFDAAELIFCLVGALDTEFLTVHDPIILKVLDVIAQAQERSVYWRPYRPIMSDPRGGVLLPLSIEVAHQFD